MKKVANVFKALNDVLAACYGYELAADYATKIKKFSRAYLDLGIKVPTKVHTVMLHAQQIWALTGRKLEPWSEEASESIHHDFKQTWQRFKKNNTNNELYGEHLLKAVSMYDSHHL